MKPYWLFGGDWKHTDELAMLIEIGKPQIILKITHRLLIAFSMVCNYFVPSTISVTTSYWRIQNLTT